MGGSRALCAQEGDHQTIVKTKKSLQASRQRQGVKARGQEGLGERDAEHSISNSGIDLVYQAERA